MATQIIGSLISFAINQLIGGKKGGGANFSAPAFEPNHQFADSTTKLVGKPLPVIYGEDVHILGNIVKRTLSDDRKKVTIVVSLCWGPVTIDTDSIRINEKRPETINGVANTNKESSPGFIEGVSVRSYSGALGQTPENGLEYGLNRTAYLYIEAEANDELSDINRVEAKVTRENLFVAGDYQTPIPAEITARFPTGVPSSNPIYAALDYLLNKDYGASKTDEQFSDYQTWLDAADYCDSLVSIDVLNTIQWNEANNVSISGSGLTVTKTADTQAWDAGAFSSTCFESGDGSLNFTAPTPEQTTQTTTSVVCTTQTINVERRGLVTERTCNNVSSSTTRDEMSTVGLSSANDGEDFSTIKHAINFKGDGNYEVMESGTVVFGPAAYTAGDAFSIAISGGDLIYQKDGSTVYTSTIAPAYPLYPDVSIWKKDQAVTFTSINGSALTEKRFRVGMEVGKDERDLHADIIEQLMQVANAQPFEYNGVIKCFIARAGTSVASLDRSNFIPTGAETSDIMDIPNQIEIEFRSDNEDGEKRTAVFEDSTRITEWGEIRENISMHGIPTRTQAGRMATYQGRSAVSQTLRVAGVADQRFIGLEPGDIVDLTAGFEDSTWFSAKLFWVQSVVPDDKNGDVELGLLEYGGDTLFDDSNFTQISQNDPIFGPDDSVRLPDAREVPLGPTAVTAVAGSFERKPTRQFYVDVSWTAADQPLYMYDKFLIYRREDDTATWAHVGTVSGRATSFRDTGADIVNQGYLYAVIAQTTMDVQSTFPDPGDYYVEALAVDVPPAITNLTATLLADSRVQIDWDYAVEPIDFDRFNVYIHPTTDDFLTVDPLFGGVTTTETKTSAMTVPGTYRITVEAADTFGNFSDQTFIDFTMPSPNDVSAFYVESLGNSAYRFNWNVSTPLNTNFSGTQLRYNISGTTDWDASVAMHEGDLANNFYEASWLPQGSISVLARGVDTAGNLSSTTSRILFDVTNVGLDNLLDTFDFKTGIYLSPDDNWPVSNGGSLTGGAVENGESGSFEVQVATNGDGSVFLNSTVAQAFDSWLTVNWTDIANWEFQFNGTNTPTISLRKDSSDSTLDISVNNVTAGVISGQSITLRALLDLTTGAYEKTLTSTNDLVANDGGGNFYILTSSETFYDASEDDIFFDRDFTEMVYTTPLFQVNNNGTMKVESSITGSAYQIEFRTPFPGPMYPGESSSTFYTSDTDTVYSEFDFAPWTGTSSVETGIDYQFRVTTDKKAPQGRISEFKAQVDVPDVEEFFNDISIGAGGTRIAITNTYTTIKAVYLTLQDDGGTSVTARVMDKSTSLGPLVQVFDATNTATTGVVDVLVRGFGPPS